jgi:ketosteroid isomerase-like protein
MHWTARLLFLVVTISAMRCATTGTPPPEPGPAASDPATVRREIEAWYDENVRAFRAEDVDAIMALRTEDFHTVGPDGTVHDRAAMEERTVGLLNGIERWIALDFALDSLEVSGDLARAVVRQHLVRMALRPDQQVHHVETWVTQDETWRRTPEGWKLYRVEDVRDQRRLVDGRAE